MYTLILIRKCLKTVKYKIFDNLLILNPERLNINTKTKIVKI